MSGFVRAYRYPHEKYPSSRSIAMLLANIPVFMA